MPPLRVFTARDTGVKTMAWSAAQDRRGAMYFGCDTLVTFDGDRWRSQDVAQSYLIRGLDIGPNGRIWVGGVNQIGWFDPDGPGAPAYHSLVGLLPGTESDLGEVWKAYAEGNEGAVFVAKERILRWDGRRFASWAYPGADVLWSTRTDAGIYFHYPAAGLLKLGPTGPTVAVPASVVGPSPIRWLDDSRPDWLLLDSEGFRVLRGGACVPLDSDASSFVRANTLTSAVSLGRDLLAIGTIKGGIAIADHAGRLRRVFDYHGGLPANQIYSLFADRDGALWAMGPSSIVRLAVRSEVSVYGPRNGYPENGCAALAENSGEVFAVSHNDILHLVPDPAPGRAGHFVPLGATSDRFSSLLALPQGLVVGHLRGLGLLAGEGLRPLGGSGEIVLRTSLSVSRPQTVLVSHLGRVDAVDLQTGRATTVADSLPDYGDTLAEESSGRLWIGTLSKGLFVAFAGNTGSAPAAPRFGSLPASGPALVSRAGSGIAVLTRDGAYFLDAGSQVFRRVPGSPGGIPSAISNPDGAGAVWAAFEPEAGGHSPRLGRIVPTGGGADWVPQSVEGLPGIGSPLVLHSVPSAEGDALWIAGSDALIRVGPAALRQRALPPRPLLRAWIAGGEGGTAAEIRGALPYATRGLHVDYSSHDYGMKESERFQTMLVGAESGWSAPTNAADRDISGLREGTYAFAVRLRADSGEVGPPAVFHFEIASPWWRTPLAYGADVVAGTLAVLALGRIRQRSLRRRAQVLAATVRQRTEELERANAAKTRFVASISHEIRNPMGGILGSSLALAQTPLGPEQRELVSSLRNCASFLASLVEDVLDFAAIEAGALKIVPAPFDPRRLLESVVAMLGAKAGEARLDIEVGAEMPETLVGDAARIQQVIVNFAVNSLKFGGKNIRLSAGAKDGCAVFAVADDGAGIPLEDQKKLFVQFSRLESVRNSAVPGTGLGLAVSRALAERMGGSVGVDSAAGRGSTFFLSLPLVVGAAATARPRELFVRGARALVVEDFEYNAGALGWMLEGLGFKVDFAADGEEALGRLSSIAYDAVFLYCDLPKVTGIEVARRFRSSETEGRRALIIATTALSTAGDRDACLAAGMDAFLAKPVTPEKLGAVLLSAGGTGFSAEPEPPPDPGPAPGREIDIRMIRRLTDGSAGGLARELARFLVSLEEAVLGVARARATGSRGALASAAHRVLSLARFVGAGGLAEAAADLQEFAAVYNEGEIDEQVAILGLRVEELRDDLDRYRNPVTAPA
jgi:signal transduction histidine kinase/CheY-like chemotaxis protein